jgi:hypothetical protein
VSKADSSEDVVRDDGRWEGDLPGFLARKYAPLKDRTLQEGVGVVCRACKRPIRGAGASRWRGQITCDSCRGQTRHHLRGRERLDRERQIEAEILEAKHRDHLARMRAGRARAADLPRGSSAPIPPWSSASGSTPLPDPTGVVLSDQALEQTQGPKGPEQRRKPPRDRRLETLERRDRQAELREWAAKVTPEELKRMGITW